MINEIQRILFTLPGIILGLSFHEFGHAFMSYRLGDPTPKHQGRLTLSPKTHIDVVGFILILIAGFGWAKPVQINPQYYKKPRRDDILVSIAGPLMNLLLAFIFSVLLKLFQSYFAMINPSIFKIVLNLIYFTIIINISLAVFNLLPIPPLDGFHVLENIIPIKHREIVYTLERYSMIILILFIITPISSYVLRPAVSFISNVFFTIVGLV